MAVDIELACNLIQARVRTLQPQFVAQVPDVEHYFTSLADNLCPYAFTWPSEGSWSQKGGGYKMDERTFTLFVIIESLAQKDIPTRAVQGIRVLQAVRNLFIVPANIPLDDGAVSGYQIYVASRVDSPQSDSGLRADLPYSGAPWFGFSIPLKVRTQWIV